MSEEYIKKVSCIKPQFRSMFNWLSSVTVCTICWKAEQYLKKNVVHLYISYTLDMWSRDLSAGFPIGNCLPGAMNLTKTADLDKCGYGI